MSLAFVVTTCIFALVLGCAVACVDWWREARLAASRLRPAFPVSAKARVKPVRTAEHRRAA